MNGIKITPYVLAVVFLISCNQGPGKSRQASLSPLQGKPEISFTGYEHDFGRVAEGKMVKCVFNFENKGTGDLVIQSASTTCGCTVPYYSKKPIAPGKQGTLEVEFDTSGKSGMQTKTISVRSNASVPVVILKIKAEVISDK